MNTMSSPRASRQKRATPGSGRLCACVLALSLLGACSGMSPREKNTAIGAGAGAIGGAVLTGGSTAGTVGGAAIGGILGSQIDDKK